MISISFINFNLDMGSKTDIKKEHKCLTFADINNPSLRLDDFQIHFIEINRFAEILRNASSDEYNKNKLLSWIDFFTTKDLEKSINKLIGGNIIMPEGIEIGIQQGIKEGIEKTKISMAINMKRDKVDLNTISKYTGLSIEDIKKL